ncbi:MAG TPA: peptidyl-prolyl cis-trans isomerase [Solirubrobacteraceae bacterium]
MNRTLRLLPALGAFFVLALAVAACGDSVPGDAVARVGDATITKAQFNRWFAIAASNNPAAPGTKATYDPPKYTACIANKRKTAPKPAKGQPATTDATYKTQCEQEYSSLSEQVMQFLILEKWVAGESKDEGLKVSDKANEAAYVKAKKEAFPTDADFAKFLQQSGMTVTDARFQVAFNTVYTALREKAVKRAQKVTTAGIAAYYKKNKARFATPQTRDVRVVLAKTEAKAKAALSALKSGQSFKTVAKKYSIDQASKATGGVLTGVAKGSQEKAFDTALFAAPKGKLTGPVKVQFGYYVFKVQKITPASQQTLKQASSAIRQQLTGQYQKAADDKFNADLRKKWKAKTNCRSGYVMDQCKNAPKTTTTSTTATPAA